jgi:hypothetical protein
VNAIPNTKAIVPIALFIFMFIRFVQSYFSGQDASDCDRLSVGQKRQTALATAPITLEHSMTDVTIRAVTSDVARFPLVRHLGLDTQKTMLIHSLYAKFAFQ